MYHRVVNLSKVMNETHKYCFIFALSKVLSILKLQLFENTCSYQSYCESKNYLHLIPSIFSFTYFEIFLLKFQISYLTFERTDNERRDSDFNHGRLRLKFTI